MKKNTSVIFFAAVFGAMPLASAFSQLNVIHSWSLGGGEEGKPAAATLKDTVGGLDLVLTGEAVYANTGGGSGVFFNNQDSAHDMPAFEYYSSDEADVNPFDVGRWGFEAVVRLDVTPEHNQELAVFELGAGQEGIVLQTFGNGAWTLHRSNVAILANSEPAKVGQRQHLAAVLNEDHWDLYVDGLRVLSIPSFGYDPAPGVRIGAGNTGPGDNRGFNGVIETVRVFEYGDTFNIRDTLLNTVQPDTDGDGFDDVVETALGFDPADPASTPESAATALTAVEFRFYAGKGIPYKIESSSDLETWETVETGILGRGEAVSRLYSTGGAGKRYFRAVRE